MVLNIATGQHEPKSVQELKSILKQYCSLSDHAKIDLDPQGLANIQGSVAVTSLTRANKFPVKFGKITGHFFAANFWQLQTLEGAPHTVTSVCQLSHTGITSLKHGPHTVGSLNLGGVPLESLEGFPTQGCDHVSLTWHKNLPLLRTLMSKSINLTAASAEDDPAVIQVQEILNKYVGQGKRVMLHCALELKNAGFDGNAKW